MRTHSGDEPLPTSDPTRGRALVTLGGPSPALAATLDVVLEEFFIAERIGGDDSGPSLNLSYINRIPITS